MKQPTAPVSHDLERPHDKGSRVKLFPVERLNCRTIERNNLKGNRSVKLHGVDFPIGHTASQDLP